uniref:Glycine rich superfamily member n=1 Tax=Rhipicephalus appendiculatus TaxID=34631 RepID=A0A131YF94_RHIAP
MKGFAQVILFLLSSLFFLLTLQPACVEAIKLITALRDFSQDIQNRVRHRNAVPGGFPRNGPRNKRNRNAQAFNEVPLGTLGGPLGNFSPQVPSLGQQGVQPGRQRKQPSYFPWLPGRRILLT